VSDFFALAVVVASVVLLLELGAAGAAEFVDVAVATDAVVVVAGAVWVADAALAPPMAVAARSPAPASAIPIRERVVGAM
jgi:hypothetical protein